ncbi:pollen receptor-like kinase 4 [Curcuma longa]|uniref:pollen receptor-like kinase 4 n=1 Tax=Curcuma longa TaxID=136217 RepID=UPI003D9F8F25
MATAMALLHLLLLLLLLHCLSFSASAPTPPASDTDALLLLKNSFTNAAALSSWSTSNPSPPCDPHAPWPGVICLQGIITGLHLSDMGLSGTLNVDALFAFPALRSLSFVNNSLSGALPADLGRLHTLKSILLSRNKFSGPIPTDSFRGMTRLKKLWLDDNQFNGPIPDSLADATALLELHLENNHFSGEIPAALALPSLSSFNVSNNNLHGSIPQALAKFNSSSFSGNEGLCSQLVVGKPCAEPAIAAGGGGSIIIACALAILLVCMALYALKTGDKKEEVVTLGKARKAKETTSPNSGEDGGANAGAGGGAEGLVMLSSRNGELQLSDLMKAEAELLRSGGMGTVYKAAMANGVAVVVKRTRDLNRLGKEAFAAEMARLGRLSHPNVVTPLAYHYRKDEKLLVLEFVPKRSLSYVLHGDRGTDHAALDWGRRLGIARGVARGLAYLHTELPFIDAPHGNLKSGNVVLSLDFEPRLTDFGYLPMVNASQAGTLMQALRTPEVLAGRPVSARSDVYCFGVLLLELMTGKFPAQYLSNVDGGTDVVEWATRAAGEGREADVLDPAMVAGAKSAVPEMVRLLRVAVECVDPEPERRLGLKEAVERIEEVAEAAAEALRSDAAAAAEETRVHEPDAREASDDDQRGVR